MKRLFDIIFSLSGLIVLSPLLLCIALAIKIADKGSIIYKQKRVGQFNTDFYIFKFKTMRDGSEKLGLLTIGNHDPRITKLGYYLRKYKFDELPQLVNVLIGNMSFVGPRPELRQYVNYYKPEHLKVLDFKPGITGAASLKFWNECELLSNQTNPEAYFISDLIPKKNQLNLDYHQQSTLITDLQLIFKTII